MNEKKIEERTFSNGNAVTIMAYDLTGNNSPQVNNDIKVRLIEEGWHEQIPLLLCRKFNASDRDVSDEAMPSTTLWKENIPPVDAVEEFDHILYTYNATKELNPRVTGKVIAFQSSSYAALERE